MIESAALEYDVDRYGNKVWGPRPIKNNIIVVETWSGRWTLDANGQIDYDAIMAFTTGHCHSFALALNKLTKWPMYGVIRSGDDYRNSPAHVINKSPIGYVDVEGLYKYRSHWEIYPVTPSRIKVFKEYLTPRPDFAMRYAQTLVQQLNKQYPILKENKK